MPLLSSMLALKEERERGKAFHGIINDSYGKENSLWVEGTYDIHLILPPPTSAILGSQIFAEWMNE